MIIISIIICSGILGGFTNYYGKLDDYNSLNKLDKDNSLNVPNRSITLSRSLLISICASATVPLFLQILNSSILSEEKYFVFLSLCVLAAFYSKKFMDDVYAKVLKETKATEKEVKESEREVKETVKELKETAIDLNKKATETTSLLNKIENKSQEFDLEDVEKFVDDILLMQSINQSRSGLILFTEEDYRKIVAAFLLENYSYRTIQGIATNSKFDTEKTQQILQQLESLGYVEKRQRVTGSKKEIWRLRISLIVKQESIKYISWGNSRWEVSIENLKYNWANGELLTILHRGRGSASGHTDTIINYVSDSIENWTGRFKISTQISEKVTFTFLLNKEGDHQTTEVSNMKLIDWENSKWDISIAPVAIQDYSSETKIMFICRKLL